MQPLILGYPNEVKLTGIAARRSGAPRGALTLGKETSEYQEEEKSNEIPLLAASENGRAQTESPPERAGRCGVRRQRLRPWFRTAELAWKGRAERVTLT
jgi:hypothetical protein